MIVIDGYSIIEYPLQDKIVITLPPLPDELTSTVAPVAERKRQLSGDELAVILQIAKAFYENEKENK